MHEERAAEAQLSFKLRIDTDNRIGDRLTDKVSSREAAPLKIYKYQ